MKKNVKILIYLSITLGMGIFIGSVFFSSEKQNTIMQKQDEDNEKWTCSMHPHITQPDKGDCPICGMQLIQQNIAAQKLEPEAIQLSKTAFKLAQIETSVVSNSLPEEHKLTFDGTLELNQNNTMQLSANFDFQIIQMFINKVGESVKQGQAIAQVYAPEINVLQEELNLANRNNNENLQQSINQKIKNYGLSITDVANQKNGYTLIRAPKTGIIAVLQVEKGQNIVKNQSLLSISDTSTLWGVFDVYQSDINKIRLGDEVLLSSNANTPIKSKIDLISPIVDTESQKAQARVIIQNQTNIYKPGTFIEVSVTNKKKKKNKSLIVPKSAVLWTGKKSIVYREYKNEKEVYYKMLPVTIGNEFGENIEILSGLEIGDTIVTQGAFTIDSEAQLQGKPSMMTQKTKTEFSTIVLKTYNHIDYYYKLKNALVNSDLQKAQVYAQTFQTKIKDKVLLPHLVSLQNSDNVETARQHFNTISQLLIDNISSYNVKEHTYIQYCPMANDNKGAYWLSKEKEIKNPYYGEAMLSCGEVKKILKPFK